MQLLQLKPFLHSPINELCTPLICGHAGGSIRNASKYDREYLLDCPQHHKFYCTFHFQVLFSYIPPPAINHGFNILQLLPS